MTGGGLQWKCFCCGPVQDCMHVILYLCMVDMFDPILNNKHIRQHSICSISTLTLEPEHLPVCTAAETVCTWCSLFNTDETGFLRNTFWWQVLRCTYAYVCLCVHACVCIIECNWVNSESNVRSELLEAYEMRPTCLTSKWIKAFRQRWCH